MEEKYNSSVEESLGIINLDAVDSSGLSPILSEDFLASGSSFLQMRVSPGEKKIHSPLQSHTCLMANTPNLFETSEPSPFIKFESLNPQEISSIYYTKSTSSNSFLNNALMGSDLFVNTFDTASDVDIRQRIQSLPSKLVEDEEIKEQNVLSKTVVVEKSCDDFSDELDDSVFIEARHVAYRISDGSIFKEGRISGDDLDSTSPPEELFEDFDDSNSKDKKCDTETIFKNIDKILPKSKQQINQSMNSESEISKEKEDQNSKQVKDGDESSTSKDVKNMLQTLSSLWINKKRSDKDIEKGKKLLENLTKMLTSSPNCDIVRNSMKPNKEAEDIQRAPDNSANKLRKSKVHGSLESLKLNRSEDSFKSDDSRKKLSCQSFDLSKLSRVSKGSGSSTASVKSNVVKKGPLRAVLPVSHMTKLKKTPKKSCLPQISSIKKTSTPIYPPDANPLAQSTPGNHSKSLGRRFSFSEPRNKSDKENSPSGLPRRSSLKNLHSSVEHVNSNADGNSLNSISTSKKLYSSKSDSSLASNNSSLKRNNSTSEADLKQDSGIRRRSNSIAKGSQIASGLESFRKKMFSPNYAKSLRDSSNVINSSAESIPKRSLNSFKRMGKENAGH